jgi:hypothetical protein
MSEEHVDVADVMEEVLAKTPWKDWWRR